MEAIIPESLFEELKEQVFETEDIVSEEKQWLKESHETQEKKKQIVEKQAKIKPKLNSREKTRIRKISDSIFKGSNTHLKKVQEANRFREKMRSQANWNIKGKVAQAKEIAKDTAWEIFKKALKAFLIIGSLFLVWKSGVFDKLTFSNFKHSVLRISKWLAENVPPLIRELPSKLTRLVQNAVKSLQVDGGQSLVSAMGNVFAQLGETFMSRVFPEIIRRFGIWMDIANFAMGVVTWATTGATIGSIIPGVGTAVGAVVGAAIGLVTGFWDLAKKKIEDDNYSKTQTQEITKKVKTKTAAADSIEKNLRELLAEGEKKRQQGIEVSPQELEEIQNHLVVLQEMREEQSKLVAQMNLYKWYFTAKGNDVSHTKIAQALLMFGIDPKKMIETQVIDGVVYIRKFNGIEFSADNPSSIFNAVKRTLENHLIQRTAGTVLEGKDAKEIAMMLYNYENGKQDLLSPEEQTAIKHLIESLPNRKNIKEMSKVTASMFNEGFAKDKTGDQKAQKAIDEITQRAKDIGFKTQEEIEEEKQQKLKEYEEIMEKKNLVVSFTNPDESILQSLFSFMMPTLSPIKDIFLNMGEVFGDFLSQYIYDITTNTKTNLSFSEEDKSFLQSGEDKMLNIVSILLPNTQEYRDMLSTLRQLFINANAKLLYDTMSNTITGLILDYLIRKGVYTTSRTHITGNTTTVNQSTPTFMMQTFQVMFNKNKESTQQITSTQSANERLTELIKHETDEAVKNIEKHSKETDESAKRHAEEFIKINKERQARLSGIKENITKWSKIREKHSEEIEMDVERKFNPRYGIVTPYSATVVKNHTSEEISKTFDQTNTESNNGEGAVQTFRE